MPQIVFVNLPVRDLAASRAFWGALGFRFNEHLSGDRAACLVLGESVFVMLLTETYFAEFTRKEVADASAVTEAVFALSSGSRERVDELADAAMTAGGFPAGPPRDYGPMYSRSFQDPDHHQWEVLWMDPAAAGEDTGGGQAGERTG
ncbi:glyoxalase [Streptomyces solincola]|uniref:Glyoxalase n=1 Tax=Streptomyces solincola TaxID=2100817 RepID=A0A2S9PXJ2_9ACTN|nr:MULTISPECIES: VOC family protein [Streptomyces]PRH79144.1 glyoxalase [Streptomyces solincola]